MSKPIETERASARVTVAGIEPGEPPSITTVHVGTDRKGMQRHFVQQVPIFDVSLYDRLSNEVSEGDEITVTVVNDWYETGHVTYLADFNKVADVEPETAAKNGTLNVVHDNITHFTLPPARDTKTKIKH